MAFCGQLPREGTSQVHVEPMISSGEGKASRNGKDQEARWYIIKKEAEWHQLKGLEGSEWAPTNHSQAQRSNFKEDGGSVEF